jgi:hypothetical protein
MDGLLILAVMATLIEDLSLPTQHAARVASDLAANEGGYESPQGLHLSIDLPLVRARLLEQLERAVEMAPEPRRGRPSTSKTGRLV